MCALGIDKLCEHPAEVRTKCIAPLLSYGNGIGCKGRGFTEVYGRLGDEDYVGNVLRLSARPYASEGIPGEPAKSENLG
jgi:hypothetical protein